MHTLLPTPDSLGPSAEPGDRTCRFLLSECDKGCEKEADQVLGEFKGGGAEKASRKIRHLVAALKSGWDGTGQGE